MTKKEVEKVIRRYSFISDAIKKKLSRAVFKISNRKFVIEISENVKSVCSFAKLIYDEEKSDLMKLMIKCILNGDSDTYIMNQIHYNKNAYYPRKQAFIDKVYKCCIAANLVSLEEVLQEEIA